jgi:hypothetical protein
LLVEIAHGLHLRNQASSQQLAEVEQAIQLLQECLLGSAFQSLQSFGGLGCSFHSVLGASASGY